MKYLSAVFLLLCTTAVFAQPGRPGSGPEDREKVERLKIAFLTEELDLTIEESQLFWPVYNAFGNAKEASEKTIRTTMRELEEGDKTEATVQSAIDTVSKERQNIDVLEAQFLSDSMAILGPEKTVKLMSAERSFKHELVRRLQAQKDRHGPPGRKQP